MEYNSWMLDTTNTQPRLKMDASIALLRDKQHSHPSTAILFAVDHFEHWYSGQLESHRQFFDRLMQI